MTPSTLNQQFALAPFTTPSHTSLAFEIKAPNKTHCFVLTTQQTDAYDETVQKYHILLVSGESRKIYDYELHLEQDKFETNLFNMLENDDANTCFRKICHHGFCTVSERTLSIQAQLSLHSLDNIQGEVINALNTTIIEDLQKLNLKVVPRIYNWLAEVSGVAYLKRKEALFDYPILLIPNISPLMRDEMLTGELSNTNMPSDQTLIITEAIDKDLPVEAAIEAALEIPAYLIPSIKGKRYWEVTAEQHPWSYPHFEENIEFYEIINRY